MADRLAQATLIGKQGFGKNTLPWFSIEMFSCYRRSGLQLLTKE